MADELRIRDAIDVADARAGDRAAFASLVARRGPRLLAHARRLSGDAEVSRDIVQDAWIAILRGLPGLRDDYAFLPWALRIVTRAVAKDIKRKVRGRALAADWGADPTVRKVQEPVVVEDMQAALALLPPDHAAVLALFYLEDMRVAEVAIALDIPPGTVKTRLMNGRKKMRAIIDGEN